MNNTLRLDALRLGVLSLSALSLSGCWSDALSCAQDSDCFAQERCALGACVLAGPDTRQDMRQDLDRDGGQDMRPDMRPSADADGAEMSALQDMRDQGAPDEGLQCQAPTPDRCGAQCVDLSRDASRCGTCEQACGADQRCEQGRCVQAGCRRAADCQGGRVCQTSSGQCVCPRDTRECAGRCVSLEDPMACGASCQVCPTDPLGQTSCEQDRCELTCQQGALLCEGSCAACPSGPAVAQVGCQGSQCVITACAATTSPCAQGCCPEQVMCSLMVSPQARGRVQGTLRWSQQVVTQTGSTIELDGSEQPLGAIVTGYQWRVLAPNGSGTQLAPSATVVRPSFKVDVTGDYLAELRVLDVLGRPSCQVSQVKVSAPR